MVDKIDPVTLRALKELQDLLEVDSPEAALRIAIDLANQKPKADDSSNKK